MIIVIYRNVFFILTALITLVSLGALAIFGLDYSTDFTGGTLVEVHYEGEKPGVDALAAALGDEGFSGHAVRETGSDGFIIRAENITPEVRDRVPQILSLNGAYAPTIERFTEIGPVIGEELRNKAFVALILVLVAIVLYVAFAFRKVSEPVSSWKYGLIALAALTHDVVVPLGFFAILCEFFGAQVDTLFVTAILTILGFSVHDTIVVFDRVRENLRLIQEQRRKEDFEVTAGHSLNQTLVRSVNTSLTVIISLGALYVIGPVATEHFALTLMVGIIAGTYSSVALATPLLVVAAGRAAAK